MKQNRKENIVLKQNNAVFIIVRDHLNPIITIGYIKDVDLAAVVAGHYYHLDCYSFGSTDRSVFSYWIYESAALQCACPK